MDFLDDMSPTRQAMLATGLGLLGTRGSRGFGRAGMMGLEQLDKAKKMKLLEEESRQREEARRAAAEMQQLQMQQVREAMAEQQRQRAEAAAIQNAARGNMLNRSGIAMMGGGGPTTQNAAMLEQIPQGAQSFNERGFVDDVTQINPLKGLELREAMAERNRPKMTTLAEGASLVSVDPISGKATRVAGGGPNPNRPFFIGEDGTPQPNPAYQAYEMQKAQAGRAPATSVSVSTPFETAYSRKTGEDMAGMKAEINQSGFRAPSVVRSLERMEQLLAGVDGGVLAPTGLEVASAANSFGIKLDSNLGNKEAAEALTREIAQSFRQPGTGPQTDKDFENFIKQSPGLAKTAEGRKQIIAAMKAKAARDIQIARMARDYEKKFGKLDDGFLEDVAQYVAINPVIPLPAGWQVAPVR